MSNYKKATPEQIKEWHDTEGKWWADRAMSIVAIASASIFGLISLMGFTMYLIQVGVYS